MPESPRLELARGLRSLRGVPVAFIYNGKTGCETLVRGLASGLAAKAGIEPSFWRKPSPYKPLAPRVVSQIAAQARAVVAGPGDCGHGSACSLLDALQLESAGLPVAWVDTPSRVPHVERRRGRYVIEYAGNRWIDRPGADRDPSKPAVRERMRKTFEKFGFHRALRLAGARAGDTVVVGSLELELWDYPDVSYPHIPDGIRDYAYIALEQSARRTDPEPLVPKVRKRLGPGRA